MVDQPSLSIRTMPARPSLLLPLLLLVGTGCAANLKLTPNDAHTVLSRQLLDAPNPADPGGHSVAALYYGSGSDRRRAEFRDSVSFSTESVDASKLISLGSTARERNGYWGFTPKEFPLNGRVWYPEGDGPFPLVLIVHGNHNPRDFSDPGYRYLGELLASRGFILVSVDMNFVNGSIRGENDARGWLLLKHVEAWKNFNEDETNPFFGKVDLENIALIGHSRGGEAVAHAAAFNRLQFYPDDASLTFDFNFNIRSIIAIAPVDGQYLPTGRHVPLQNINYLVFHGSHDGDVTSFHGLRQYNRLRFTDGESRFKAAVYVYRANHGQWNQVWNNRDNGPRSGRILELRGLIPTEEQRRFGEIYISAFLETTLRNDIRYTPLFRDHRVAGDWLPKTMYITRYQHSSFTPIADFEEDIDLTTGTIPGTSLAGQRLRTWRESSLVLRSRNRANTSNVQSSQAVWLGWNNEVSGNPDSIVPAASYTITLDGSARENFDLSNETMLEFLLAPTTERPGPHPRPSASDADSSTRNTDSGERDEQPSDSLPPMNLSVEALDTNGNSARVSLARYGAIRRPLEIRILRRGDLEESRFDDQHEIVLQSYSIPLRDFAAANGEFDPGELAHIRFVFDGPSSGTIVLDDVGFANLPDHFSSVSAAAR